MELLWKCISGYIVAIVVCIVVIIVCCTKKSKYSIFAIVFMLICITAPTKEVVTCVKDVRNQETTEIVATYKKTYIRRVFFPYEVTFSEQGKLHELQFIGHLVFKDGERYRIEYYNNSKVIKSYVLLE